MTMRITGLSSGLDIESMVTKLMQAQRMPVDKLMQQKQILQWQRDGYREMNSLLLDLRGSASGLKFQSAFLAKKVSSSDESIITATANGDAVPGSYNIKVTQAAQAPSVTSGNAMGAAGNTATQLSALGMTASSTVLNITGAKGTSAGITVSNTDSLATVLTAINAQSNATGVTASYDAQLDRVFFSSTTTGTNSEIKLTGDPSLLNGALKLNASKTTVGTKQFTSGLATPVTASTVAQKLDITYGTGSAPISFTVTNTTTAGDLLDQINNNSTLKDAGVFAYLDSANKLTFYNPNGAKTLSFADGNGAAGTILADLGLPANDLGTTTEVRATGKNARVNFNGIVAEYASNNFSINNISFNAKKADLGAAVSINVTQDVDKVFDSIKSFVDKYNDTIDKINKKLTEEHFRDYQPLTDEQKKAMKDTDITLWQDKAKSGLLRGDSILSSTLQKLRLALSDEVQGLAAGSFKQLGQIGITTGAWQEKGKLYIDEAKLKAAIGNKPEQVMRVFNADDGDSKTSSLSDGVAVRLYDKVNDAITQLTAKAGSTNSSLSFDSSILGKNINDMDSRISKFNSRLVDVENRYYRQFTAMETALSKMNSQSAWLASQFAAPKA